MANKYYLHISENVYMDRLTDGRRTNGKMDRWTDGRWTNGKMDRWTDGQMDRWSECLLVIVSYSSEHIWLFVKKKVV